MRIILLAVILFTGANAVAQVNKGTIFLGGDIGFGFSNYKSDNPNDNIHYQKSSSFNFSPSVGWVVKENMVVGGRINLAFFKYDYQQNPSANRESGNNIGAAIYVRKYLPLGKSFYLFGDASLGGQSNYRKGLNSGIPDYFHTEKGYSINAMIYPGIAYQITKCLFLEMALNNLVTLGYTRINTEQQGQNVQNYKGVNNSFGFYSSLGTGVPIQVGMRWMIAKK